VSFRALVMRHQSLAQLFMSNAPESLHTAGGRRRFGEALHAAATRTKAYPAFLAEHGVDVAEALRRNDPKMLPTTSKRSYIERYSIGDLCLDGRPSAGYTIEKSSGYSGASHYWFRTPDEDALFPAYLEFAFRQFYKIDRIPTLIIIGLALGTWTSGEKMAQALRQVAATGKYELTVTSPGINSDEILETVRDVSPFYGQTVIVGYPPFVKSVIDRGIERGIDWKRLSVKLGLGGEGYSEEWRAHMAAKLGVDVTRDLLAISGGYGAADLGMSVGREYPLTVQIRQLCASDSDLAIDLFGEPSVPNLFQYNPSSHFIEEVDGELVFSVLSGIPLVRYRIGDRGGTLGFDRAMSVLSDHGYDVFARLDAAGYQRDEVWSLPLFYCSGRTDGTIIIGGLNVYPENIGSVLTALADPALVGYKVASVAGPDEHSNRLLILLEHRGAVSVQETARLAEYYAPLLIEGLQRVNKEYRRLSEGAPELARPEVRVYGEGRGPFAGDVGKIKKNYLLSPNTQETADSA